MLSFALIGSSAAGADTSEHDKMCKLVSEYAEAAMQAHQIGVPLSDVLENSQENMRPIVLRAYAQLRWPTDKTRTQAVARFRDEVALECYQGKWTITPD